MPRAKTGVVRRRKHKKILKLAKGYWGLRSKSVRKARETLFAAGNYAYAHRKRKKRDFRKLWIVRINAACRANGGARSEIVQENGPRREARGAKKADDASLSLNPTGEHEPHRQRRRAEEQGRHDHEERFVALKV